MPRPPCLDSFVEPSIGLLFLISDGMNGGHSPAYLRSFIPSFQPFLILLKDLVQQLLPELLLAHLKQEKTQ